jgi:hypothetical protein
MPNNKEPKRKSPPERKDRKKKVQERDNSKDKGSGHLTLLG